MDLPELVKFTELRKKTKLPEKFKLMEKQVPVPWPTTFIN